MIFRKVADVRKEAELAERRKNDPQPELAQDHLVRKIFSKFRKPSEASVSTGGFLSRPSSSSQSAAQKLMMKSNSQPSDPELGQREQERALQEAMAKKTRPSLPQVVSDSGPTSRVGSAVSKTSRWAACLANASHDPTNNNTLVDPNTGGAGAGTGAGKDGKKVVDSKDNEDKELDATGTRRTELVCRKSEHIHIVKDIRPPTQGNKWPKMPSSATAQRPETIDETCEPDAINLATAAAVAAGAKGTLVDKDKQSAAKVTGAAPVTASAATIVMPRSINNSDYQQIIASLIDMRVDLKLEIQKLSNKVGKMDAHVEDVTKQMYAICASSSSPAIASHTHLTLAVPPPSAASSSSPVTEQTGDKSPVPVGKGSAGAVGPVKKEATSLGSKVRTVRATPSTSSSARGHKSVAVGSAAPALESQSTSREGGDEMRAMLESEIAEQEVEATDDDQDLTSKL